MKRVIVNERNKSTIQQSTIDESHQYAMEQFAAYENRQASIVQKLDDLKTRHEAITHEGSNCAIALYHLLAHSGDEGHETGMHRRNPILKEPLAMLQEMGLVDEKFNVPLDVRVTVRNYLRPEQEEVATAYHYKESVDMTQPMDFQEKTGIRKEMYFAYTAEKPAYQMA